jgi:hypothetical protein
VRCAAELARAAAEEVRKVAELTRQRDELLTSLLQELLTELRKAKTVADSPLA